MSDRQLENLNDRKFYFSARMAVDVSMICMGLAIAILTASEFGELVWSIGIALLLIYVVHDIRLCFTHLYKINQLLDRYNEVADRNYIQL